MRRRRTFFAVLAAGLLFLSACSNGSTTDGDDDDAGAGGSVTVAAVWTGTEQDSFQAVLDAFTEETGIEATYSPTGDDVGAFLGSQIEGGSPPDVAMLPQPGLLRDLAGRGALQPAGEEATANLDANYAEVWKDLGSVDGTLYGVYFKAANKSTWWYNTGVFESAGVEAPADWDGMLETAGTVSASGTPWVSLGGADGWTLTDWFENIYIRTAGPEMYDQLTNHEIHWDDQSVIDALDVFGELVGDEQNLAGGVDGSLQADFPTSVAKAFADPPEAATVYEGDFVAGVITGDVGAPEGSYDFFDFPAIDGSPASVIGGGDVAVALTDNEAAQSLLAYLATPEAAQVWAELGGFTSPNQNLDVSAYPDEISARSAAAVAGAETFRFDMSDLQPAAFGGTPGRGLFLRFQDYLSSGDAAATAAALEKDAARVFNE